MNARWMSISGSARRILSAACVAAVMTGGIVSAAAGGMTRHQSTAPAERTAEMNRRAAIRDAAAYLQQVMVPAGAVRLTSEPSGDHRRLAAPAIRPATPALADEHAWWRVPAGFDAVRAYVETHPPPGARIGGSGATGINGQVTDAYVAFSRRPVAGVIGSRSLVVQVARLNDGSTGVRADAQDTWIIPRSPREVVPPGVREVDITRGRPGQSPSVSVSVRSMAKVRRIIAMIDALPRTQPGAWSCPGMLIGVPVVTFRFMARHGATVRAIASEPADVREPTTPCDPLSFSVRGRPEPSLLRGAAFLRGVQRLIGVQLTT